MDTCKVLGSADAIARAEARRESTLIAQAGQTLITVVAACRRGDRLGDPISPAGWTEEVGAVLKGRFELIFDDETRALEAGHAAAIDQGQPHAWRCVSERGVLYRVAMKAGDDGAS
ncbi:MAG TPA: cupin domain-containing protein [Candidatus Binataceae bacterium]|nr:cupin domain-containing protein [Candidatus Binataceae bacterium]